MKIQLLMAIALFSSVVYSAEKQEVEDVTEDDINVVTVTGNLPKDYYRREFQKAEKLLYAKFNQLIDKPEFKVYCENRAKTGSRMKRHTCEVGYMKNARAEDSQAFLRGESASMSSDKKLKNQTKDKRQKFEKMMVDLYLSNAEFKQLVDKTNALKQKYQEKKDEQK